MKPQSVLSGKERESRQKSTRPFLHHVLLPGRCDGNNKGCVEKLASGPQANNSDEGGGGGGGEGAVCSFCNMQQSSCNCIPPGVSRLLDYVFSCPLWQICTEQEAKKEKKPRGLKSFERSLLWVLIRCCHPEECPGGDLMCLLFAVYGEERAQLRVNRRGKRRRRELRQLITEARVWEVSKSAFAVRFCARSRKKIKSEE